MQRLVFTHIGKAAGSSVRVVLRRASSEKGIAILAVAGASSTLSEANLSAKALAIEGRKLSDFGIVVGHVPFCTARKYLTPAAFATSLRDPRERMISNYASQPANMRKDDFGLSEFSKYLEMYPFDECAIDNYQTRMLANSFRHKRPVTKSMLLEAKSNLSRHYAYVGRSDDLNPFLARICALYGIAYQETPSANLTGPYQEFVTDEHRRLVQERNRFDEELFSWAERTGVFSRAPESYVFNPPVRERPHRMLARHAKSFIPMARRLVTLAR